MPDSDITTTILKQLRDELRAFRADFRSFQDEVRGEFSIVNTVLRDAAGRLVTVVRYIKKHEAAISRLEKKVG